MTSIRSLLDKHYMVHQHVLGDMVAAKASALPRVTPDNERAVVMLVHGLYRKAVALGSRYYGMASVAHGHGSFSRFPDMPISDDHIMNAIRKSDNVPGALHTLVLSGARDVIIKSSLIDMSSDGWDRIAEPGACDFCRAQTGGGEVFPTHYNCECIAAPKFKEARANVRS
jgi:hypothetical protein